LENRATRQKISPLDIEKVSQRPLPAFFFQTLICVAISDDFAHRYMSEDKPMEMVKSGFYLLDETMVKLNVGLARE
jgi:hypothetical protein